MFISIVVPLYNEKESVPQLVLALRKEMAILKRRKIKTEIILVDDGSSDGTFEEISKASKKDKRIRIVKFRRNFGQTAAFDAGFRQARGDVIITMDGDLQNDPADIPLLLKELSKGYDVVSGWRHDRQDARVTKKLPSLMSNYLARWLTGLQLHDFGCSLKAYRKETLQNIRLFGEMHRYIPGILFTKGYKISEVKVKHQVRKFGYTKYNITRLLKGFLDLLYIKFWSSYSTRPLHLFGLIGFILFAFAGAISIFKLFMLFAYAQPITVSPALLLAVLSAIIGMQFIIFGFLGEISVRTYYNTSKETEYEIERII
ncbi:MAG: glycosyltransferase family 2 protein [Candidatus Micrarchaeota archaeon]